MLHEINRQCVSNVKDLNFRQIDESNYQMIGEIRDLSKVDSFLYMYKTGQFCLGAFDGKKIIGHAVLIPPIMRHQQVLVKNGGFIHFCYVAPEYRGQNVYPRMLIELIDQANLIYGIKQYAISTDTNNFASQKGINKVGFSHKQRYKSISWWRITIGRTYIA